MDKQNATIIYGAVQHLASIAAVATLMGTGHLSEAVGAPILAGLVGIGVGAGAALIIPGVTATPSGALAQPSSAGGVVPAPVAPAAPAVAPVQAVQPVGAPPAAPGAPGASAPVQGSDAGQPATS